MEDNRIQNFFTVHMDIYFGVEWSLYLPLKKTQESKTPTENILGHSEAKRSLHFKTEKELKKLLLKAYLYSGVSLIVLAGEFLANLC